MAAQNLSVRLQRSDSSTPWGFRLQGGLDFSTPLSIQRVNPGSLSDQTGLQAGDAILRIGNENAAEMKHKDAQDMIVRCGNYLELTVQRGAVKIWKPSVTPVNELKGGPVQNIDYGSQDPHLFKTSLAADKQDFQPIGSSHNIKPKPFITGGPPASGPSPGTVKAVVHAQYNSPVGLYSSSNIADTLATQTQGLIQGIQGISVSGDNQTPVQSAVLQAVQQEEYTGQYKEEVEDPVDLSDPIMQSRSFKLLQQFIASEENEDGSDLPSGMRKVAAPVTQPGGPTPAAGGQPLCGGCGRLIIGVFVRVNNKPLHAECFTCATCGSSLKNTGYFTINEKLYCETHARQLTKPPGPNYEPVSQFNKPQQQQQQQPWKQPAPPAPAPAPAPPAPSAGPARQPGGGPNSPWANPQSTPTGGSSSPWNRSQGTSSPTPPWKSAPTPAAANPSAWKSPAPAAPSGGGSSGGSRPGTSRPPPRRGRGVLNQSVAPGTRIPICSVCGSPIRGRYVTAMGKNWCPEHFLCANPQCRRNLQDIGFVEENSQMYCEFCYERYFAPICAKCNSAVIGDCVNAMDKQWHPDCFVCAQCRKPFGNSTFFLEAGQPYCEADYNEMFMIKCAGCNFPIEAGDRWVEALNNNYHSTCFNCTVCHSNLEGKSFYAKGGYPFCKAHG